eukprot:CFRG2763T1
MKTTPPSPQLFVDALQCYAYSGDVACLLAPQSSLLDLHNKDGDTPLHIAIGNNNIQAVCAFASLMKVAGLNAQNADGDSALHLAVRTGQVGVIDLLSRLGADVTVVNTNGRNPLHLATSDLIVHALLAHASNEAIEKALNTADLNGDTPLLKIIQSNNLRTLEALVIDFNADVNAQNTQNGRSGLHLASRFDNVRVAHLLLEFGAKTESTDMHGATPLNAAMQYDAGKVTRLLVDYGADVTATNGYEVSILETGHNYRSSRALAQLFAVASVTVHSRNYLRTGEVMLALKYMSISNPDIDLPAVNTTPASPVLSTHGSSVASPAPTSIAEKPRLRSSESVGVPPAYSPNKMTSRPTVAVDVGPADPDWQVLDKNELDTQGEAWHMGNSRNRRLGPVNFVRNFRDKKDKQKKKSHTPSPTAESSASDEKRRLADKFGTIDNVTINTTGPTNASDEKKKLQMKYDLIVETKEGTIRGAKNNAATKAAEVRLALDNQKAKAVTSLD